MKIYLEAVMRHKASCDLQDIPLAQYVKDLWVGKVMNG